jgi:hypothetical protein
MTKSEKKTNEEELLLSNPYEQPITTALLLRSYTLTERLLSDIRKKNDDNLGEIEVTDRWGMSTLGGYAKKKVKASDIFVQYESRTKNERLRRIAQIQNQRSKVFHSLDNLIRNGVIAESERDLFNLPSSVQDFPYRQITQMRRIMVNGKEYFSTEEQIVGINNLATVVTIPIPNMHWFIRPYIEVALRNADGTILQQSHSISEQPTTQVSITSTTPDGECNGRREYITPFTVEIVNSALKQIRGELGNGYNGCSMSLYKEGAHNGTSVKTIADFLGPFDEIWSRNMESKPTTRVDTDQLLKDLKRFGSAGDNDPNEMQQYK